METEVRTWHLVLTAPTEIRASPKERRDLQSKRVKIPSPALNRFFYATVGRDWYWHDRLEWTDQQWLAWLDRPELQTWVGYVKGTPVGYFELELQRTVDLIPNAGASLDPATGPPDRPTARPAVEIAYFGLLPQFVGQGLGGTLLTQAARRGFRMGGGRVWVHTCSLDHPEALANYQARGFRVFKEEVAMKQLMEQP